MFKNLLFLYVFIFIKSISYSIAEANYPSDSISIEELRNRVEDLPIIFRQNAGQWDDEILYRGYSGGSNIYFLKNSLSFTHNRFSAEGNTEFIVWNMHFEGAENNLEVVSGGRSVSRTNYILGADADKHVSNVADFREIRYSGIYKNIDLKYYGYENNLKYDYILKPGSDVGNIRMKCEGVDKVFINKNGELEIKHKWGVVKEDKPYSYQVINGKKIEVDVRFAKHGDFTFGFQIAGAYNPDYELTIDPVTLKWVTYVGGTDQTKGGYLYDLTMDEAGFVYATGYYPASFPVTAGAYDNTYNGGVGDAFVFKLAPDGKSLIYATYIGGNEEDRGNGIAVNSAGEVFITGHTLSAHTSFPVTTRIGSMTGGTNAFVCKLNSAGTALIYSTYIGGLNQDIARDIKVDNNGNAYVCGETKSATFPITGGSLKTTHGGGASDGFLLKLNPTGTSLLYSTFIGGSSDDRCKSLAINNSGEAFITGYTSSTNFPATWGVFKGSLEVFVSKVNSAGSGFVYSAIISGTNAEEGNSIDINKNGQAFVTGYTFSADFPVTIPGDYKGLKDAFVCRLNAAGNGLVYSRYIGGAKNDEGTSIVVSQKNEAFIAGTTGSETFPKVGNLGYELESGSQKELQVFMTVLSGDGATIKRSHLAGGSFDDYKIPSLGFSHKNIACLVSLGFTSHSPDLRTTEEAFQRTKLNGNEANDQPAVIYFDFGPPLFDFAPIVLYNPCDKEGSNSLKGPAQMDDDYPLTYNWHIYSNGSWSQYTTKDIMVGNISDGYLIVSDGCNTKTILIIVINEPQPWFEIGGPSNICDGKPITLYIHQGGNPIFVPANWSTGEVGYQITVDQPGTYTAGYPYQCTTITSEITIEALVTPVIDLGPDRVYCFPNSIEIDARRAQHQKVIYSWSNQQIGNSVTTITQGGTYTVTVSNICGTATDDIFIEELRAPEVDLGDNISICGDGAVSLNSGYPTYVNLWSTGATTPGITVTESGTYSVEVINICGTSSSSVEVDFADGPPEVDLGPDQTICDDPDLILDAGNPGATYLWSTGETTQQIHVTTGGKFVVRVTNGCGFALDTIEIISKPALTLNLPPLVKVCAPGSVTLNAGNPGGVATYLWSDGSVSNFITVSEGGLYSVTVTNSCGVASAESEVVIEDEAPVISLGSDFVICRDTPTTLTVSGTADSYLWSTGETGISIDISNEGNYWVEAENSCGSARADIDISFYPTLSVNLGTDRSLCAPAALEYNAGNPGAEYLWSTGETTQTITANQTDKYWVRVSNECEVVSDTTYLTLNTELPQVDLGDDLVICAAFSLTLDAGENPGSSFRWSPGNESTQSIDVNTGNRYIVEVTNGCGTVRDTLLIISIPLNPFNAEVKVCYESTVNLDAGNPGSDYLWSTAETSQIIIVSEGGQYHVEISNVCGIIEGTAEVSIETEVPQIDLGPDIRACSPISVILDAGDGLAGYLWSTGETSSVITVTAGGIYTVTCLNSCGSGIGTINITEDLTEPKLDLGPDILKCTPFTQRLSAGFSNVEYLWYPSLQETENIFVAEGGIYSCVATNSCGQDSASIEVKSFYYPQIALESEIADCQGPLLLDAGNEGSSFLWTPGGQQTQSISVVQSGNYAINIYNICGLVSKNINVTIDSDVPQLNLPAEINLCSPLGLVLEAGVHPMADITWSIGVKGAFLTVADPGMYSVTVINSCGESTAQTNVLSNPVQIAAGPDSSICFGTNIQLHANYDESYVYDWTPADMLSDPTVFNPLVAYADTSAYFYVTVNNGTCWNIDSVYVNVYSKLLSDIKANKYEGYIPLSVEFVDRLNNGENSYIWYFGDGDSLVGAKLVQTYNDEGYHQVLVQTTSPDGCRRMDTLNIRSFDLFIPNLVTVNGDGKNDFFELTKLHDYLYVEIYNRWGELVFRRENYVKEWPGSEISDGVYFYYIKDLKFNKEFKGWVQVVRSY
jgi:hypothetical protein